MTSEVLNEKPPSDDFYNDYDMRFTADISRRMQMPERLAAVDGMRQVDGFKVDAFTFNSAAFGMTMPDRIYLGELLDKISFGFLTFFASELLQGIMM